MLSKRGFTLIEMMIAIAITAILLAFGLPMYGTWMNNMRIRGAAEAVQNGLQLARAAAISRNTQAYFVFQTDGNLSFMVYTAVSPSGLPANFRAPAANLINMLQQYDQTDESGVNTAMVVAPAGTYMVTFGSLGQVLGVNPDGSAIMTQVNVNSTANATRPLVVEIAPGGGTKMCDPDPGVPLGDPRHC